MFGVAGDNPAAMSFFSVDPGLRDLPWSYSDGEKDLLHSMGGKERQLTSDDRFKIWRLRFVHWHASHDKSDLNQPLVVVYGVGLLVAAEDHLVGKISAVEPFSNGSNRNAGRFFAGVFVRARCNAGERKRLDAVGLGQL
jgi:hypothetical protein